MRPNSQSIAALTIIKSTYQSGKRIRIITMEVFIYNVEGSYDKQT